MQSNGQQPRTPKTNGNGYIVVPKWFVSFLSFMTSVVFVSAVLWAWSMSNDVSAIKAELNGSNDLRRAEIDNIRRRLDRHDVLIDRVLTRTERP